MSEPNAKEGAALTPSFGGDMGRRPTGWRSHRLCCCHHDLVGISARTRALGRIQPQRTCCAATSVLVVPDRFGVRPAFLGWVRTFFFTLWLETATRRYLLLADPCVDWHRCQPGIGVTTITLVEPLGDTLLFMAGLALLVFFYEALPEELIFRGYFYTNLATRMPLWLAVVGQAVLFTLWGLLNGGENSLDRSLLFFTFAIIVGIFRVITGSIWVGIGFHLVFQTFAQLFGSVGSQFTTSSPAILTIVAFGILPFAFSITILRWFYPQRPNWRDSEPDPRAPIKEVQP